MTLQEPRSTTQEVLHALITKGEVSIKDFGWMSGFRTRISELRIDYNLKLESIDELSKNKHNRTMRFKRHILVDKKEAIDLYGKLCKEAI